MNRKGAMKIGSGIILAALIVAIIAATPAGNKFLNDNIISKFLGKGSSPQAITPSGTTSTPPTSTNLGNGACLDTATGRTLTIGPAEERFAPTTSVTGEYHRIISNGVDKGLKVDQTTEKVAPGDDITIYYGDNSTTYYAAKVNFIAPCDASFSSSNKNFDSGKYRMYRMDTSADLNAKCLNDDNGLENEGFGGTGGNESLTTSESVNIPCSIQGTSKQAFSPYGGVYITIMPNSTAFDTAKMSISPTTVGWSASLVATPKFRTDANLTTGFSSITYRFMKTSPAEPGRTGIIENEKLDYTVVLDTGDETGDEPTPGGAEIKFYFDDEDYYRDTITGLIGFGPTDDTGANVGSSSQKGVTFKGK